jgi:hypothetical protein
MKNTLDDWQTIRNLLWDDDEYILIGEDLKTIGPMTLAERIQEQPAEQFCCANGFGQGSTRNKASVKRRHTFVIEFDHTPLAKQRELWETSALPHTLRVFSGNKSIHVFIRLKEDVCSGEWNEIANALTMMFPEADSKVLLDLSRFCRTPNGTRENGERQTCEHIGERVSKKALRGVLGLPSVTERTEAISSDLSGISDLSVTPSTPEEVIRSTLPKQQGERSDRILSLARGLKFNSGLGDIEFAELRPIVKKWHKAALPVIGTKDFDTTWGDFVHAWKRARFPLGQNIALAALDRVKKQPWPEESLAYDSEPVRRLVAVCRMLGGFSRDGVFFISRRDVAKVLGQSMRQAERQLEALEADELIKTVRKGVPGGVYATRFKWIKVTTDKKETEQDE